MYNVVQETMSSGVLLRAVTGSIFEAENNSVEGVAIFVMCGLTAFRPDARDYVKTFGAQTGRVGGLAVFSKHTAHGDITCLYDGNRDNKIYGIGELHALVDVTLTSFAERGIRRVAMNGIRIKPENRGEYSAEASLLAAVKNWCFMHERAVESIDLVDMRGGFGKIAFESVEGKATDLKAKELDYQEVRRVLVDCFSRNGIEAMAGEKVNPYLFAINVSRSFGEAKVSQAFNETFHALGLLPPEVMLTPGDWCDYCGFFLDEDSDTYLAMFNHPEAKRFKTGSEAYQFTLRGMYESEGSGPDEIRSLVDGIKAGSLKSETLEGYVEVDAELYDATNMADHTIIYRDFTKENLLRMIGIATIRINRGCDHADAPSNQMLWTVEKVMLLDVNFNECDPFNVPEDFLPTTIAIHLGKRIG